MGLLKSLPTLTELPLNAGDPPHSAWGLWGFGDTLGSLNYMTDDAVLDAAKKEIQTGERVGLDCSLDMYNPPLLGRVGLSQEVINKDPLVVNDDVITFNTQCSSQWDSMRHFAYQKEKKFYNGTTQDDIHKTARTGINSLQSWTKKGLAGRGVLIDFASWAKCNGREYKTFEKYSIELKDVQDAAKAQGVDFKPGDVLFLRTGYVGAYRNLTFEERTDVARKREWTGLGQGKDTTEWLWERQFSAVASDSPGFECRREYDVRNKNMTADHCLAPNDPAWHLHPILLAGWGTPIGELFDLEALASLCARNKRWTFFFTSAPLNFTGAVASPPNAIAIQ